MNTRQTTARPGECVGGRGRGFTLVELLVVVGVVAMLFGMLLPVVGAARRQAQRTGCAGNLRQLGHSYHLYADAHGGQYPPPTIDGIWPVGNLGGRPGAENEPHAVAILYLTRHLTEPRVVYCPAKGLDGVFAYGAFEKNWKAAAEKKEKVKWTEVYSGYPLYAGWRTRFRNEDPNGAAVAQDASAGPGTVLATDVMVNKPIEWNNHRAAGGTAASGTDAPPAGAENAPSLPFEGGNVLLNDGSVEWRDQSETRMRAGREHFGFDRDFYF